MVSSTGRLLLSDFGTSSVVNLNVLRWTSKSTMTRTDGTVRFMAPELLQEREESQPPVRPTFSSDIYSLGCVMYEVRIRLIVLNSKNPFYDTSKNMPGSHWYSPFPRVTT